MGPLIFIFSYIFFRKLGPLPKIVAQILGEFDLGRGYPGTPTGLPPPLGAPYARLKALVLPEGFLLLETIVEFIKN